MSSVGVFVLLFSPGIGQLSINAGKHMHLVGVKKVTVAPAGYIYCEHVRRFGYDMESSLFGGTEFRGIVVVRTVFNTGSFYKEAKG